MRVSRKLIINTSLAVFAGAFGVYHFWVLGQIVSNILRIH